MRMFLIILGMLMVVKGRHAGLPVRISPVRVAPVQAKVEIIINNSVSSSANGEECVKSEVIEKSGEGNISIESQLECESDSNDDNVVADSNIRPGDGEGGGGVPESGNGIPPVRENILDKFEKLIIFDRESYRKYVLGMGEEMKYFKLNNFILDMNFFD